MDVLEWLLSPLDPDRIGRAFALSAGLDGCGVARPLRAVIRFAGFAVNPIKNRRILTCAALRREGDFGKVPPI
jgi:hypothetical protein